METKIDFSVVITTFNEEKTIIPLLESLIHQTLKPDEILIVDAGSSDKTRVLIERFTKKTRIPLKLINKPGSNRSVGRNLAIDAAKNDYIAVTDAGCEAEARWLERLAVGYKHADVDAVAGYYLPDINHSIQRLYSMYVSVSPEAFNPDTFLPSSRSFSFKKSAWEKAGKYPEHLDTCEDLVFAARIKKVGVMTVNRAALVYWKQADSISAFFRQIKGYAEGDVRAVYWPHLIKICSVFGRYLLFAFVPLLFFPYMVFIVLKKWRVVGSTCDGLALPIVQVIADMAVITGSVRGIAKIGQKAT